MAVKGEAIWQAVGSNESCVVREIPESTLNVGFHGGLQLERMQYSFLGIFVTNYVSLLILNRF